MPPCKEQQRPIEFRGFTCAPHGGVAGHELCAALVVEHVGLGHLGGEPARSERVDAHPLAAPLAAKLAGQVDQGTLRGAVAGVLHGRRGDESQDRRDVDDAALAGRQHRTSDQLTQVERRNRVDVHRRGEVLERFGLRRCRVAVTGVVDQHVDASADLQGDGRQAFTVGGDGQIGRYGGDPVAQLGSERVQPVGAARCNHHMCTCAVQHAGEPVAEPGRGAGHHRHPALQSEQRRERARPAVVRPVVGHFTTTTCVPTGAQFHSASASLQCWRTHPADW